MIKRLDNFFNSWWFLGSVVCLGVFGIYAALHA